MRHLGLLPAALASILTGCATQSSPASTGDQIAITGITIIDVASGRLAAEQTVVIRANRIVTPLPEWAAEFDAKTWAQVFLKYVVSHPAVIVARVGTTKAAHMLDNIGGGIGRLPNDATRKRMAELVDALPARQNPLAASQTSGRLVTSPEQTQQSVVLSLGLVDGYVGSTVRRR